MLTARIKKLHTAACNSRRMEKLENDWIWEKIYKFHLPAPGDMVANPQRRMVQPSGFKKKEIRDGIQQIKCHPVPSVPAVPGTCPLPCVLLVQGLL